MTDDIHPIDLLVGQRVKALRLGRGMSQTALASQLGVTFQQLQKYEKGTNRISASRLFDIAKALGVTVSDLYEEASAAYGNRDHVDADFPSSIDLQIANKLTLLPNDRRKRQLANLISALVEAPKPAN